MSANQLIGRVRQEAGVPLTDWNIDEVTTILHQIVVGLHLVDVQRLPSVLEAHRVPEGATPEDRKILNDQNVDLADAFDSALFHTHLAVAEGRAEEHYVPHGVTGEGRSCHLGSVPYRSVASERNDWAGDFSVTATGGSVSSSFAAGTGSFDTKTTRFHRRQLRHLIFT
jgi:hypothetical protein